MVRTEAMQSRDKSIFLLINFAIRLYFYAEIPFLRYISEFFKRSKEWKLWILTSR